MKCNRILVIAVIWISINDARCYPKPPFVLSPFRQLGYDLQSGPITIFNETFIHIANLYYNGRCPEAHFWVGKGKPSSDGNLVTDEIGSESALSAYNGRNVTIQMPKNLTIEDIDYLAVWCVKIEYNVGHVFMDEHGLESNKSQTQSTDMGINLGNFNTFADNLRSGPIILIGNTFYVSNLHFDGKDPTVHFWAGKGTEPSVTGTSVPNENNSNAPLTSYEGESIYVNLPPNMTINDIEYFGIWSIDKKISYGYVNFNNSMIHQANGNPNVTENEERIIRVQKCCPLDEIVTVDSCAFNNVSFNVNVSLHISNNTHIIEAPMPENRIKYVPYTNNIKCEKYYLDPLLDNYSLLTNGYLLYISEKRLVSLDEYCLDTVKTQNGYLHTAFVCVPNNDHGSKIIHILYATFVILSAVCFLLIPGVYFIIKEHTNLLGISLMLNSTFMAVAFLSLGISQIIGSLIMCKILGFLFHFTIIAAFTLLNIFIYEIHYHIRSNDKHRKRYFLLILAFIIPSLFVLCTIQADLRPGLLTNYLDTICSFTVENKWLLYFPIVLSIATGLGVVGYTRYVISKNGITNKTRVNKYHLISIWIIAVTAVCWGMEVITFYIGHSWEVFDVFHSLQGLVVLLIVLSVEFKQIKSLRRKQLRRHQQADSNGHHEMKVLKSPE